LPDPPLPVPVRITDAVYWRYRRLLAITLEAARVQREGRGMALNDGWRPPVRYEDNDDWGEDFSPR